VSKFEREIQRGVVALDRYDPNWRSSIQLFRLDMREVSDCVVGQLFHVPHEDWQGYVTALRRLGARFGATRWAIRRGFHLPSIGYSATGRLRYRELTEAWLNYLTDYRTERIRVAESLDDPTSTK
jgi:hypothetical protein